MIFPVAPGSLDGNLSSSNVLRGPPSKERRHFRYRSAFFVWYDEVMTSSPLEFESLGVGNVTCTIYLDTLYPNLKDRQAFEARWVEFLASDEGHDQVLARNNDTISYQHKSWIPTSKNDNPAVLFLFGNPAPHSVVADVYFAYEGKGIEHRFWKVLRELNFVDLHGDDKEIKKKFLELNYESPFRLGFEVIYTFPTSASKPKWSGVTGLERLFGRRATAILLDLEKMRLRTIMQEFLQDGGVIVAMQKDAYNAVSQNVYSLKLATEGNLRSEFAGLPVYGTPPTRWLYTSKMKDVLVKIREALLK